VLDSYTLQVSQGLVDAALEVADEHGFTPTSREGMERFIRENAKTIKARLGIPNSLKEAPCHH
jgi:hypothetical protein